MLIASSIDKSSKKLFVGVSIIDISTALGSSQRKSDLMMMVSISFNISTTKFPLVEYNLNSGWMILQQIEAACLLSEDSNI